MYNLMTGAGFEGGAYSGPWFMAWLGLALLAIIVILSKKWLQDEQIAGQPYSFIGGIAGSLLYLIIIMFLGEAKWAFAAGLVGLAIGGFGLGRFTDNG